MAISFRELEVTKKGGEKCNFHERSNLWAQFLGDGSAVLLTEFRFSSLLDATREDLLP
jgi:hypothetical protein